MYGKVYSCCLSGIDGQIVEVEIDIQRGLPLFHIVGLPDSAVRESAERVRAAIRNSGFEFPMQRITVNLAPADIRKEGAAFDLAIALGILITSGQWQKDHAHPSVVLGELSLDGSVREVPGVLPMVHSAHRQGYTTFILPENNAAEASYATNGHISIIRHLQQLEHGLPSFSPQHIEPPSTPTMSYPDLADVRGQHHAKRAVSVAAAGMHNILLSGPPGAGKTMLLRRMPGIMPDLDEQEAIEVSKIYSIIRPLDHAQPLVRTRPFRSPHHNMSLHGLIGGGSIPRPGEISLAHKGVLFLDELPEFSRSVLESLRQPLEDGEVTISRARATYTFPCRFVLAAAMNPCPCGKLGSESADDGCECTPAMITRYRNKISGPLLDRIDLQVEMPKPDLQAFIQASDKPADSAWSSARIKAQVLEARERQAHRLQRESIRTNGEMDATHVKQYCKIDAEGESLLQQAFQLYRFSARTWHRLLKLARTVADLGQSDRIETAHLAEALQYRFMDKAM